MRALKTKPLNLTQNDFKKHNNNKKKKNIPTPLKHQFQLIICLIKAVRYFPQKFSLNIKLKEKKLMNVYKVKLLENVINASAKPCIEVSLRHFLSLNQKLNNSIIALYNKSKSA